MNRPRGGAARRKNPCQFPCRQGILHRERGLDGTCSEVWLAPLSRHLPNPASGISPYRRRRDG
jgi:hypothetical protein